MNSASRISGRQSAHDQNRAALDASERRPSPLPDHRARR